MTYTGEYDPKLGYSPARSDGSYCIVCHSLMGWCSCRLGGTWVTSSEFTAPYTVAELLEQRYVMEATRNYWSAFVSI